MAKNNLRAYRQAAGFSIKELSELAGVSTATIMGAEYEAKNPRYKSRICLAAALDVDVDELFPYYATLTPEKLVTIFDHSIAPDEAKPRIPWRKMNKTELSHLNDLLEKKNGKKLYNGSRYITAEPERLLFPNLFAGRVDEPATNVNAAPLDDEQ